MGMIAQRWDSNASRFGGAQHGRPHRNFDFFVVDS
jgi:hypothetical protein